MANQPGDKEASLFDINLQLTENGKKVLGEIHPSPEVRANLHIVGYPCSNQHLSNGMPHISPRPPNLADDLDFDWVEGGLQVEQEYEQYDPVCFFWKNGERVPCMSRLSTAFPLLVPTGHEAGIFANRALTLASVEAHNNARGDSNAVPECVIESEIMMANGDANLNRNLNQFPFAILRGTEFAYNADLIAAPQALLDGYLENYDPNCAPQFMEIQVKRVRMNGSVLLKHHYGKFCKLVIYCELDTLSRDFDGSDFYLVMNGDELESMYGIDNFTNESLLGELNLTVEHLIALAAGDTVDNVFGTVLSLTPRNIDQVVDDLRNSYKRLHEQFHRVSFHYL